ncbi:phytanoyl-dioxygenase family protein [Neofusicoccum parvum]|uniref:Phytanoyl-dioxygenase family protein n=1 Tax=Neofusicoccum parvum TaxID=310453 RepID=A0ACB5RX91_9PEZI|nr:phytanoyl-dioxygenase family protein [Neofusicoccum parvum]
MTTSPASSSGPIAITLTPQELATNQLTTHTIQAGLHALHTDGLVVLTNAIPTHDLTTLSTRMQRDAAILRASPSAHHNFGQRTGNVQQEPPTGAGWVFSSVVANAFATQLTECLLGPRPALRFYSANTAFRGRARQPVHVDLDFPAFPTAFPFGFCVNACLDDVDERNGATEVWLGSHVGVGGGGSVVGGRGGGNEHTEEIDPELVEERRKIRPPVRLCAPKGALVIRDFRLWHAGMPNQTDVPRIMLVTIHFARWWRSKLKVRLEEGTKVEWGGLEPAVEWVGEGYDYLRGAHDFTFAQDVE